MTKPLALTLGRLRLNTNTQGTDFVRIYKALLGDPSQQLVETDKLFILKIAITFIESTDKYISRLGYRLVLLYYLKYNDKEAAIALRDISILLGYMPIVHSIEREYIANTEIDMQFSDCFLSAYKNTFTQGGDSGIIRTSGQMLLHNFAAKNKNTTVVAPTSYGKSELMIKKIKENVGKSICVIVPSKALLSQTKRLISKEPKIIQTYSKIITHPDMYHGEEKIVAALTQERLLRLLKLNPDMRFDIVLLDEAHNLLGKDSRSILTAQVLLICFARNSDVDISFYTPFIANTENVELITSPAGENGKSISEHMKIERFYYTNHSENKLYLYDQFLNKTLYAKDFQARNTADFIQEHSGKKNLVYVNRPVRVEEFANSMAMVSSNIKSSPEINEVVKAISQLIHAEYSLIDCIKSGVLFHHGGLPDVIRLFVEDFFSKNSNAKYLICTSTLLEGVNIPAEKIFITTPQKYPGYLTNSEFKNLIGRVCRFSEIFNENTGNLNLLQPEVYLLSTKYSQSRFSPETFYKNNASISICSEDSVNNPLLKYTANINQRESELQYLENIEPGTTDLVSPRIAETEIGKMCFANGVRDFDILVNERQITQNFEKYFCTHKPIENQSELLEAICSTFLSEVILFDDKSNLKRIRDNVEARTFYSMFIGWRASGAPYGLMVNSFLKYWANKENPMTFIGSKWGEVAINGWSKLWVDLRSKSRPELVNLAIAKIKEEQDYVDHNIMQYAEVLHDMEKINDSFYDRFKYGTDDKKMIVLLKSGMSIELAKLLLVKYSEFIKIDELSEQITVNPTLIETMEQDSDNKNIILIFEARNYL